VNPNVIIPTHASDDLPDSALGALIESVNRDLEATWFEIAGRYMELKLKNTVD
jgi:hypothetical protein